MPQEKTFPWGFCTLCNLTGFDFRHVLRVSSIIFCTATLWWSQKSRQFEGKNKIKLNHTREVVLVSALHLCRRFRVSCLMQTLLIVKSEIRL